MINRVNLNQYFEKFYAQKDSKFSMKRGIAEFKEYFFLISKKHSCFKKIAKLKVQVNAKVYKALYKLMGQLACSLNESLWLHG